MSNPYYDASRTSSVYGDAAGIGGMRRKTLPLSAYAFGLGALIACVFLWNLLALWIGPMQGFSGWKFYTWMGITGDGVKMLCYLAMIGFYFLTKDGQDSVSSVVSLEIDNHDAAGLVAAATIGFISHTVTTCAFWFPFTLKTVYNTLDDKYAGTFESHDGSNPLELPYANLSARGVVSYYMALAASGIAFAVTLEATIKALAHFYVSHPPKTILDTYHKLMPGKTA